MTSGHKKGGFEPAAITSRFDPAQAERHAPPEPSKLLLLGFLCLLGLLRCLLLRFLSHSILVWVNGRKRDSEACSGRASLATASIDIRTDSLAAFPHRHSAVMALSTAVLHFAALFAARTVIASASEAIQKPRTLTGLLRRVRSSQGRSALTVNAAATRPTFINSKPRRGLRRRGQSPLSAAAPSCGPTMGI